MVALASDPRETARDLGRTVCSRGERSATVANLKCRLRLGGYVVSDNCTCDADLYCEHMEIGVLLYQRFFYLPTNGRVDLRTLKSLREPRCGVPDLPPDLVTSVSLVDAGSDEDDPFSIRFNSGPWPTRDLTFNVANGTPDMTGEGDVIAEAFDVWAAVSPLSFRNAGGTNADIQLSWQVGDHGDGANNAFDGAGGVLAHGFYPENGRVHFDDAERWRDWGTLQSFNDLLQLLGTWDLRHVAIHEIGHALGLGHSRTRDAIMFPNAQNGKHDLGEEDIRGILSLYPFFAGNADLAGVANLWAFGGGSHSAVIDLGRERRFLAWGEVTFVDPLTDYDRDNGVALDIFTIDGDMVGSVGSGGDHLGTPGSPSNLFPGARVGRGRHVQFRLSTFHSSDLEAYGVGCVVVLDD